MTRSETCLCGVAAALALMLTACSQGSVSEMQNQPHGHDCVDDSARCIHERRIALDGLMADRQRTWIRQPATVANYASGVRLFAYKQRRRELSCEELRIGEREASEAARTLRGPAGRGLSQGQIGRGAMLGDEVARDLKREASRRCR